MGNDIEAQRAESTGGEIASTPSVIVGAVAVATGEFITTNGDLATRFDTTPEVIFRKTGIESRPLAGSSVRPLDLAMLAAEDVLNDPSFDSPSLSMIMVSSSSITQVCPPVACEILAMIQRRHPHTPDVMAFDIMATCTGWLYGVALACDHLNRPGFRDKSVLLVTTEIFSQGIAPDDFGAWASFGDAATATLIWGPDAGSGVADVPGNLRMRRPFCFSRADIESALWGPPLNMEAKLKMDGYALRQASLPAMVRGLQVALEDARLSPADLSAILAHQSNQRVLADLAREFGVDPGIMASNMRHRGNTSSCALPLLLHDQRQDNGLTSGSDIGFTAFGGGFTYGGAVARVL